ATAEGIEFWAPARATHVLVAGLAMAVAMGALGASLRRLFLFHAVQRDVEAEEELSNLTAPATATVDPATGTVTTTTVVEPPGAVAPAATSRRVTDDLSVARTLNGNASLPGPRFPAGRFWFLSAILFLIALGFGVWFLISLQDKANFDMAHVSASTITHEVWQTATQTRQIGQNRRGFHIGLGIALIILPLLLAISVRFMIRMKWLVVTLCLLTFLCICAEIWIGALLSYRGHEGPIYKFPPAQTENPDTGETAMVLPYFESPIIWKRQARSTDRLCGSVALLRAAGPDNSANSRCHPRGADLGMELGSV
ncbi:MAG TPA: hypothetical protein VN541_00545, partial [Tepidisphaeraceae bacterium]|nr:hypothetical protein [Tepidisphaeraceae bacterium]